METSSFDIRRLLCDAGYESEENYLFLEKNVIFIKPMNYEISKTRKYKKDIGKMENMEYDPEKRQLSLSKQENANSPISEKTKDSTDISDGDCLSNAMNVKDVRSESVSKGITA